MFVGRRDWMLEFCEDHYDVFVEEACSADSFGGTRRTKMSEIMMVCRWRRNVDICPWNKKKVLFTILNMQTPSTRFNAPVERSKALLHVGSHP